jgi:hypothetical protein
MSGAIPPLLHVFMAWCLIAYKLVKHRGKLTLPYAARKDLDVGGMITLIWTFGREGSMGRTGSV